MPKKPLGLRDCSKFWIGITGLKNPIGDHLLQHNRSIKTLYMYEGNLFGQEQEKT